MFMETVHSADYTQRGIISADEMVAFCARWEAQGCIVSGPVFAVRVHRGETLIAEYNAI